MNRVVILSAYYYPVIGGVESHARDIAKDLSDKTQVVVLTSKLGFSGKPPVTVDGVQVQRVGFRGRRNTMMKWLLLPFAFVALVRKRHHFDLIYCPGFQGIGLAAILAARLTRKKVVVQAGNFGVVSCATWDNPLRQIGVNPNGLFARVIKRPFRWIYALADEFICIASSMGTELLDEGIEPSRIHFVPNSVNTELFRPPRKGEKEEIRKEEGWPVEKNIALFVGRLGREKGILDLIDAWKIVDRTGWHLVVIGPDMTGHQMDVGAEARRRVTDSELNNDLRFVGPRNDVHRLLRTAELFIQPSHYEAFGISVIEAMSAGVPVVATRVGGMLDYLDDSNAILCNPKNADDLAASITEFQNRGTTVNELSAKGLALVRSRFSETVVLQKYRKILIENNVIHEG